MYDSFDSIDRSQNGLITAAEWFSESVILVAVSPFQMAKPGAILYAFNIHNLDSTQILQEVELNFKGPSFTPSLSALLPRCMPTVAFPYICSIHVAENHILCCTTHRLFYLFSVPESGNNSSLALSLESLNTPSLSRLPVQFVTKGELRTDW